MSTQSSTSSLDYNRSGIVSPEQMVALNRMSQWRIFFGISIIFIGIVAFFPLIGWLFFSLGVQITSYEITILSIFVLGMFGVVSFGVFVLYSTKIMRQGFQNLHVESVYGIPQKHATSTFSQDAAIAAKYFPGLRNQSGMVVLNGVNYGVLNVQLPEHQNMRLFRSIQNQVESTFFVVSIPTNTETAPLRVIIILSDDRNKR